MLLFRRASSLVNSRKMMRSFSAATGGSTGVSRGLFSFASGFTLASMASYYMIYEQFSRGHGIMTESLVLLSRDVATEHDYLRQQIGELKVRLKNLENASDTKN